MADYGNDASQPFPPMPEVPLTDQISNLLHQLITGPVGISQEDCNTILDDIKYSYLASEDPKSAVLEGPTLQDSKFHNIKCSRRLTYVMKHIEKAIRAGTFPDDSPIKLKLESIYSLWTSACSLKQIDRYLSLDQAQLNEETLVDGRNLNYAWINPSQDPAFYWEFLLRKLTIAFLHLPGILELPFDPRNPQTPAHGYVDNRLVGLRKLYFVSRVLLHRELKRIKADKKDNFARNLPGASAAVYWVRTSRKNIVLALEALALLACHRPGDPTDEELLDQKVQEMIDGQDLPVDNVDRDTIREVLRGMGVGKSTSQKLDDNFNEQGIPFLDSLSKKMRERLTDEGPLDPLLMDLLRREDEFEVKLAVEHYEDKLVAKQFSLLDEQSHAEHRKWDPEYSVDSLSAGFRQPREGERKHAYRKWEDIVFKIFQDMGQVNRHRRNFRLLRDWIGKRPWKQIYQLYDCKNRAEPDWVEEGIAEFHNKAIWRFEDNDHTSPAPSSYKNIVPKVFGFLPIDISNCLKTKYGCDLQTEKCTLCQQLYYQGRTQDTRGFGSTIVELHCRDAHKFHLKCIFDYWDARGKYLHSCPTCGDMAKLNYETVGLDPPHGTFVHNNQNYTTAARVAPYLHSEHPVLAKKARELYDVPPVPLLPRRRGESHEDLDKFPNPPATEAGRAYFESEIQHYVAMDEMPVFWQSAVFFPGQQTSTRFTRPPPTSNNLPTLPTQLEAKLLNSNSAAFIIDANLHRTRTASMREASDRVARDTGNMYLQRQFDAGRTDVYDVEQVRILPVARVAPAMEAALFRGRRRRREYIRREEMRRKGKGLVGLK